MTDEHDEQSRPPEDPDAAPEDPQDLIGDAQYLPEERQYVTVTEAARALGFSAATIDRWISQGRLPYVLVAGARRVRRTDLEAIAGRPRGPGEQ